MKKITRIISLLLCAVMLLSVPVYAADTEEAGDEYDPIIVAYYNVAANSIFSHEYTNIDVLNYHPAHIATSAMDLTGAQIITHDYSSKLDHYKEIAYRQNPDIKFLFTLAVQNLTNFESWFYNRGNAAKLAKEILSIIKTYGYDGFDIDYEFPGDSASRKTNFVYFMQKMREGLNALEQETGKEYYLSMAVPGGTWAFSLFNMNDLANYVDYFNIMNYDLHVGDATKGVTHHHTSPYDDTLFPGGSVYADILLYLENGIPAEKIVPGCGLYSRRWTGVSNVNNGLHQPGTLDDSNIHYSDLKARYINKNGYVKYWDDVAKAPYLYNKDKKEFITYDDPDSVKEKCKLVAEHGVRGLMVFDYCTTDGVGLFDSMQGWYDEFKHQHEYTSEVTKEATCAEEGVITYTCECGDSYTEAIPTIEHVYTSQVTTEPTCSAEGVTTYTCECGDSYTEAIAMTEHVMGEWQVTKAPTYITEGVQTRACENCEYTEEESVPVLEFILPPDVVEGKWYVEGVTYCMKQGYFKGNDAGLFCPDDPLTREQFLVVLAGLDGVDLSEYDGETGFSDVPAGKWYSKAVKWAADKGYTSGIGNGEFGLGSQITREQLATFFYNYAVGVGMDTEKTADLSVYEDNADISKWAKNGMSWAVEAGLVSSTSSTVAMASPKMTATRAQAARMFMVFDGLK